MWYRVRDMNHFIDIVLAGIKGRNVGEWVQQATIQVVQIVEADV